MKCAACQKEFTGRRLNQHHWKEQYTLKQVKQNPQLALHNTTPVCIPHHQTANALRKLTEQLQRKQLTPKQLHKLIQTMPQDMKQTLTNTLKQIL